MKKKCKQDSIITNASIEDLHDYVAASDEHFTYNVKESEGVAKWYTVSKNWEDANDYVCVTGVIN